jgi:hypothetical protein
MHSAFVQLTGRILGTVKTTYGRLIMKQLTVYALAIVLIVGTTAALAGDRGKGNHHRGYKKQWAHSNYHHRGYYGGHFKSGHYYAGYFGAALVGAALTANLYHTHNGAHCYDRHPDNYRSSRSYSEVPGCYRIERFADGSERRVELPMSQCR